MKLSSNVGIALRCQGKVSDLLNLAQYAERSGFDSVWLVEVSEVDVIGLAAALSCVTQKIKIATGVVNSTLRLPTLLAMGAATNSELSGGRFILGVGAGDPPMSYRFSQPKDRPILRLCENIQIVRSCLSGESVVFEGELYEVRDFKLGLKPRHQIPKFGAAMGLKMVQEVAKVADGLLLMMPTIEHLRNVKKVLSDLANKKQHQLKKDPLPVACHILTSVSKSAAEAERNAKKTVARYLEIPAYRNSMVRMGFSEEVQALEQIAKKGDNDDIWHQVSTKMADSLVIYGTPEECVEKISQFVREGVDYPVIYPSMIDVGFPENVKETIRSFAPYVEPSRRRIKS
jgi:alkanesulfonate monooxygenase SsuD/methylene tetrahydromethanopterin reductase-like flavin-dependent oxidoreductase (luciferase family)